MTEQEQAGMSAPLTPEQCTCIFEPETDAGQVLHALYCMASQTAPAPLAPDLLSHLASVSANPFIPELHTDDCDDTSCVRCRTLTPSNLYAVDTWLDNAGVFTKQFWEDDDGEIVITGLRIGHGETRVVAKFGNTIVRHYDGSHTVRPTEHPTGELTSAEWNARHPVGTAVTAYSGARGENPLTTRTRSKAWTLGGHTPVVLVDGHSGGIALTHVDPAEQQVTT